MARTAPAPNIPAIPGMNPGVWVMGGGGGGGGGNGSGGGGAGGQGGSGNNGGSSAGGDGKTAPDPKKYPECGTVSHPIDVVTGRVFTHAIAICALPGPLPLVWERSYSATMAERDTGLGFGWAHTLGWEVEVRRGSLRVWNDLGTAVDFPRLDDGQETLGKWGYALRREAWGFIVEAGDGLKRLFSFLDEGGRRARLTAVEDRNKNRIALTYDDATGRLVEVTDSAGRRLRLRDRLSGGERTTAVEVLTDLVRGEWRSLGTLTCDGQGDLVSATDADGHAFRYRYHEGHLLAEDTDRVGLRWHFVYDLKRRGVASWGEYPGKKDPSLAGELPTYLADGKTRWRGIHHCRLDYADVGFTEVTDFSQHQRFHGNEHGTLDKRVIGGGVMTASYRADGALLSRTNERGGNERFERNARGSVLAHTDPLGNVTTVTRDTNDLPVTVVDPKGGTYQFERDPRGNVTLYVDPAGGITSRRYDGRGLCIEEISPRGERAVFAYDAHGNLTEMTLANGATFRYRHDALGRRIAEVDPFGAETRYRWSARGDLVEVIDALGGTTRYTYDGEHHLTSIVDPNGSVTSLEWGGYHKLCLRRDANGHEVRLGYSPEGELVEVRNERGEVHRLERDRAGRLVREVTFDGRTMRYRHDFAGDLIAREDDLERVFFSYDLLGRLIKRELPDETEESFEYDSAGDLVGAVGPLVEVAFTRDALGRVVREVQRLRGVETRVEVAYDPEGERIGRKTSLGHSDQVERGVLGARWRTVLDGGVAVEHTNDLLGREVARALPGGGRLESAYDPLGRLERRRATGKGQARALGAGEPAWVGQRPERVTADTAYRYDPAGELVGVWDQARGQTAFQYDPVGQLLARIPEQARAEVFRYDPTGNLYEGGAGDAARRYAAGNTLVQKGDTSYHWDRSGRLVEKRVVDPASGDVRIWAYTWNGAGLLATVTRPDGEQVAFAYDPLGRRTVKELRRASRPGERMQAYARTRFVWDGDVLVHEVAERAQSEGDPVVAVKTYCFEDDGFSPVAHRDAGGWFHYVNDPIGTPERLVGKDGAVACELRRQAWGRTEVAAGSKTGTALRFPGQYEDEETGLCYNRFRYYDPEAGRFISSDPIGLLGGENAFRYAPNPSSWLDPLGLAEMKWDNPKSEPTFGHTFKKHGSGKKKTQSLTDTARSKKTPQGQWTDDKAAAALLASKRSCLTEPQDITIPPGLGNVIMPNGTIVPTTKARLIPNTDNGGYVTAFPIPE